MSTDETKDEVERIFLDSVRIGSIWTHKGSMGFYVTAEEAYSGQVRVSTDYGTVTYSILFFFAHFQLVK